MCSSDDIGPNPMSESRRRWLPVAIVLTGVGYIAAAPAEPLALQHFRGGASNLKERTK